MNRQRAIDALIEITVEELLKDCNQIFLTEFLRNGFTGFAKMSDQRLEQELVYRGLKDCLAEDDSWDDDDEFDDEPAITIYSNDVA